MVKGSARCHRCEAEIPPVDRVGRRDACLKCGSDLHCCLNCCFRDPAYHNECRETQAERQVDKGAGNFCEYFSLPSGPQGQARSTGTPDARAQLDALFAKKGG